MTDKELHKLKRAQLLDLMLAQSQEIERLEKKLGEHEQKQNTEDILETETFPALEQLERELKQENYKKNFSQMFRSTLYTLVIVAAVAVLVAVLLLPVLKIYGMSMNPVLFSHLQVAWAQLLSTSSVLFSFSVQGLFLSHADA